MARRRERTEIIYDLLLTVQNSSGIRPTRLLSSSKLSPVLFKDYYLDIIKMELISESVEENGRKKLFLTEKGHKFIQEYSLVEQFMENFGLYREE